MITAEKNQGFKLEPNKKLEKPIIFDGIKTGTEPKLIYQFQN